MFSLWTFVKHGLADADRRLERLVAARPADDAWIAETIERSSVCRAVLGLAGLFSRAAASSSSMRALRDLRSQWMQTTTMARRRAVGLMLVVAVLVHVALRAWQGHEPGWLWLTLPSMAGAIGLLLVAASRPVVGDR
jgi:hypothetical protein